MRELNPEIRFVHCFIYCEANVDKNLPTILKIVLDGVTTSGIQGLNSELTFLSPILHNLISF
jgi:hypothetical protein